MRPNLLNPSAGKSRTKNAAKIAKKLYSLHEAGKDTTELLLELGKTVGITVSDADLHGAFGSIDSDDFAKKLCVNSDAIPSDLTREEMIELIQFICAAKGTASQLDYWIDCLVNNTGDARISDLIYWPEHYFPDGAPDHELEPEEILDIALSARKIHL
ncbi:MAG: hypothetical protein K2Z81_03125 [Cyanobacteria bacterium]|nr:hypothetical protein [Cyanobacteriota bacterium]